MRSLRLTVLALASVAFLGIGCGKRERPVDVAEREGRLLVGNSNEPVSLDPQLVIAPTDWRIVATLFEPLVIYDPSTKQSVPGAAERWSVSPDGATYMFHLRPNAKWSDGEPVTASDFVFAAKRLLSPRLGSTHSEDNLLLLVGAPAFRNGTNPDFSQVGIRALDTLTLEMCVARPAPFFLTMLRLVFPVPEHAVVAKGEFDDRSNPWAASSGSWVSNGRFVLKEWTPNNRVVVKANPLHWDAPGTRRKEIIFFPNDNPSVEEASFKAGQLHVTATVPSSKVASYKPLPDGPFFSGLNFGTYFLTVNVARPPLNDRRVRQALALAIDRQVLTATVLNGAGVPAEEFTPPGLTSYEPPRLIKTDLAKAKQLLSEAGFPEGKGFPNIELLMDTGGANKQIAETVQLSSSPGTCVAFPSMRVA